MKRLILLLLLTICLYSCANAPTSQDIKELNVSTPIQMKLSELRLSEFSLDNLITYIALLNADHREIIIKQAILETGHFKSNVFRNNNNLFGMKIPRIRQTTAISYRNGFSVYNHWTRSVDDYLILQQLWKVKHLKFYNDGYEILKLAHYAENPNYIKLLKQIKIPNYDCTS